MIQDDRHLSVQDVYNVVTEHLNALDTLWPDAEQFGPRKVHVVELIDAIKLKLAMVAEKNASKYESPFQKAANKITGGAPVARPKHENTSAVPETKSAMQLAHEEAKARMKR